MVRVGASARIEGRIHEDLVCYCGCCLLDDCFYAKATSKRVPHAGSGLLRGSLGANDFEVAAKDCKKILELEPSNKVSETNRDWKRV